jgi:hypothetical protein
MCSGPITLTSHVTSQGKTVVAVAASVTKGKKGAKGKTKATKVTTDETVGGGSYAVSTGHTTNVTLALNATGRALLDRFFKLPVTATFGGSNPTTEQFTFSYPRILTHIFYSATFNSHCCITDAVSDVSFEGIPKGAKVQMVCRRGGCSPKHRTFKTKGSNLSLGRNTVVVSLRSGAAVDLEVTLANHVGRVLQIANAGAGPATDEFLCLAPDAKTPTACP